MRLCHIKRGKAVW